MNASLHGLTSAKSSNFIHEENSTEIDYGLILSGKVLDELTRYYPPVLVFLGSIGNILSLLVLSRRSLRNLSSSYFLAALNINDTCFLMCVLITWLAYFDINISNYDYACQILTFMSGLCSFLSVWLVVAFTAERFVAVLFPLRRRTLCTVKKACKVLLFTTLFGCLFNAPQLFLAKLVYSEHLNEKICGYRFSFKVFFCRTRNNLKQKQITRKNSIN